MMCAPPIIFATLPLRVVTRILLPWAQHLNASINALQKKKGVYSRVSKMRL